MPSDGPTDAVGKWVFECQVGTCNAYRETKNEVKALDACRTHADNTGHFDFEIRDPNGEVEYP